MADVIRPSKERPLLDVIRDIRDMLGVIAPADFVDPAGDKMRAAESAWCLADNVLFAATVAPAPETPPTSKELSDKLRECLEAAKGFGNSTFAPVPFAIVQQLIELLAPDHETNSCAKFRIGDDVVVTRWHAPAKVKGFIYELEDPFQYPERERDLSPPAQKALEPHPLMTPLPADEAATLREVIGPSESEGDPR